MSEANVFTLQACQLYVDMLRKTYGPELVLQPHILPIEVFDSHGGAGQLALHAL